MGVVNGTASDGTRLLDAVTQLRGAIAGAVLPFALPGREAALAERAGLLHQLDDYALPRLRALDAPLLAVVGGSTGSGKSTLVNSLINAQVSRSGVIRPTTTRPVLVHHPDDAHWFTDTRILPRLSRVTGAESDHAQPGTVRLVRSTALEPGLALLDAPDIDSVVEANRALAGELLAAADLWLFVTTAARYADAAPWELLRLASQRGASVAVILNRVAPSSVEEIRPHLVAMLREQELATAPVFSVVESPLTPAGFLPEQSFARLKGWLTALSRDARAREIVVGQTLRGVVDSLRTRTDDLARAAQAQREAQLALQAAVDGHFADALAQVEAGMTDGRLLRGEVLARWQEFVGTGEFFRQVESKVARWRDRLTAAIKGTPLTPDDIGEALQTGVAALVTAHGEGAVSDSLRDLRRLEGGATVLDIAPDLPQLSPGFRPRVERLIRDWQGEIFAMVRAEGGHRRTNARLAAYGVNGVGLLMMLVAFAHTGGLSGVEFGIAGGTSVLAQRVLEAIFGDQAVRRMAAQARRALFVRVEELYAAEQARFTHAIASVGAVEGQSEHLRAAARAVEEAAR